MAVNKKRPQQLLLDEIMYPESCFVQSWQLMPSGRVDYEETVQTIVPLQKPNLNAKAQRRGGVFSFSASLRLCVEFFLYIQHLCRLGSSHGSPIGPSSRTITHLLLD